MYFSGQSKFTHQAGNSNYKWYDYTLQNTLCKNF